MTQYYLPFNRRLTLTNDHDFSRPIVPMVYEVLGCWNCASEGWVSLPDGNGGEYYQPCRICGRLGECKVSVDQYELDPEWFEYDPPLDLSVVNAPLPLFFPDTG